MVQESKTAGYRDDGLEGKVAIITGGASGIGQALAIAYARAGASSVVGYFPSDPHDVNETVKAVEAIGGLCTPVSVDVQNASEVESFSRPLLTSMDASTWWSRVPVSSDVPLWQTWMIGPGTT